MQWRVITTLLCLMCLQLTGAFLGCRGLPPGMTRWGGGQYGQGTIERQKNRAVTFDPYPLNDIGPPVVGGRPREFANPLPEAQRNELTARPPSTWNGYGR